MYRNLSEAWYKNFEGDWVFTSISLNFSEFLESPERNLSCKLIAIINGMRLFFRI